jgi:hypothetical protein
MDPVTEKEAFLAMYAFLADYYERTKSNEVGGLLGSLSLLPNGSTADAAMWDDWQKALQKAKDGTVDARLKLKR